MRTRRVAEGLLVESLPMGEWLRALLFMVVGSLVMWQLAPSPDGAPSGFTAVLLLAALAMTAVGLWYAVRTRGDRALFVAGERQARLRSVGLLPGRERRRVALEDIHEVLVNVRGDTGGGARWRPVLRLDAEELPLSHSWFADRAVCEAAAAELRAWLAEQGVDAPARAAEEQR